MRFRGWLYGLLLSRRGRNLQVASDVRLVGLEKISTGKDVYIGPGTVILASYSVTLHDEAMLAYRVLITDGNHTRVAGSFRFGPRKEAAVVIGRGAWVAAHSTILPGTSIGNGALIGANSVVTRDIPPDCLAAGVPAHVLRVLSDGHGPGDTFVPFRSSPKSTS